MQVTKNDALAHELLVEFSEKYAEDRSGQHPSVGDLIRCVTRSFYDLRQPVETTDQTKVYFLIGLGLEEAILGQRQNLKRNGEYQGVYYHLDSLDNGWFELKSTRISPNPRKDGSSPGGAEGYLQHGFALRQFLSYAKTQGVLELDLGVVWLIQGGFDVYHVTFTQEEVDTNWEWLAQRRDVFNKAMADRKAPKAFQYNEQWECTGCQYNLICAWNHERDKGNIDG